jgi:hypothetical protein
MTRDQMADPLCARVFDRLVERGEGDLGSEPELAAHVGTCMACFRAMTELRDAPRLAAILRADPPPLPQSARFWDDLAARTVQAAEVAVANGVSGAAPASPPRAARRWFRAPTLGFASATLAAAAAAVLLVSHRAPAPPVAVGHRSESATLARSLSDDELGDVTDMNDLDGAALRRLVERLRAGAPGKLTAPVGSDPAEAADVLADDDERVNDVLVDLDGPALLRLERSLGRPSL